MLSKILIIDKRRELPAKYRKALTDSETSVEIAGTLKDALGSIQQNEPDLIIISDSIDEKLTDFCEKIRVLTYNTRPVIIALSKSADSGDRILTLECGADDFLSEPVNIEEFKSRIHAHLRRDIELSLDSKTLLPNKKYTEKSLKRILKSEHKHAVLMVGVENLRDYNSVYSDLAGDKLIQTFIAITKSTLETEDFIGQLNDTNFIIITNIYKAEKIAEFLTFAFDTVAPKFYSEADSKRGYMLLKGDHKAGMRANFVSILIGGIVDFDMCENTNALIERLYSIKKLAKIPSGSNYVIDRLRLSGESSPVNRTDNNIYICESDEALSLLLRTTLELQGYDVTETLDVEDSFQPSILILDSGDEQEGLEICKKLRERTNFVNSKIIITATIHDKTAVLDAGADLYLPKPYEITELIQWIEYFRKQNTLA